jgi:hypothetical protein
MPTVFYSNQTKEIRKLQRQRENTAPLTVISERRCDLYMTRTMKGRITADTSLLSTARRAYSRLHCGTPALPYSLLAKISKCGNMP